MGVLAAEVTKSEKRKTNNEKRTTKNENEKRIKPNQEGHLPRKSLAAILTLWAAATIAQSLAQTPPR